MNIFRYRLHHDFGLAPNPFWGFMTLAVCKEGIRRNPNLKVDDWVVGCGSCQLNNLGCLIYAMKVQEILTFDEYWNDKRFEIKKPRLNGSLAVMYGDNFYHTDKIKNKVIQEDSAHSCKKFSNLHLKSDIKGKNVLISQNFFYFGNCYVKPPVEFLPITTPAPRGFSYKELNKKLEQDFVDWLTSSFKPGVYGDPISWEEYFPEQSKRRLLGISKT